MAFCVSRGRSFQGTTIGLAPLKAMCSDYQSGGVNTARDERLNKQEYSACMAEAMETQSHFVKEIISMISSAFKTFLYDP